MKKFAAEFAEGDIDRFNLASVAWHHHMALMDKTESKDQYVWYLQKAVDSKLKRAQRCMEDEMRKITLADVMRDIQNELKNE